MERTQKEKMLATGTLTESQSRSVSFWNRQDELGLSSRHPLSLLTPSSYMLRQYVGEKKIERHRCPGWDEPRGLAQAREGAAVERRSPELPREAHDLEIAKRVRLS